MIIIYLTALEGYQLANRGLFHSQVIKMLREYGTVIRYPIRLVSLIRSKNKLDEYITSLADEESINYNILEIKNAWSLFYSRKILFKIADIVKDYDDIVFITRESLAGLVALRTSKLLGKKSVVIMDKRGLPADEAMVNKDRNIIYRVLKCFLFQCVEAYTLKKVDGIRVVSSAMRDFLTKKYKTKRSLPFIISPTGISEDEVRLTSRVVPRKIPNSIIYVGGKESYQRVDDILTFFESYAKKRGFRCYFAGYDNDGEIELLKKNYKNITFLINLSNDQILNVLDRMEYGLCLRDRSVINRVSSPTKISEYITRCVKVIYDGQIGVVEDLIRHGLGNFLIDYREFIVGNYNREITEQDMNLAVKYFSFKRHAEILLSFIKQIYEAKYSINNERCN